MAKRIRVNKGDVFKADLGNGKAKYLQYVMLDPAEMNSEVIRVFSYSGSPDEEPNLKEIVASEIEFYAHVVVKWGVQMELWEKVGNIAIEKDFVPPFFRSVPLYEKYIIDGKIQFCETDDWVAWQAGQSFDDRKPIGKLTEATRKYFLGGVIPPMEIIERMKMKKYSWSYFT